MGSVTYDDLVQLRANLVDFTPHPEGVAYFQMNPTVYKWVMALIRRRKLERYQHRKRRLRNQPWKSKRCR